MKYHNYKENAYINKPINNILIKDNLVRYVTSNPV